MRRELRELKIQRDRDQRVIEDLRRIVEHGVPVQPLEAPRPTAPCGACRQVLREFGPGARVLLVTTKGARAEHALEELLPHDFGPTDLGHPEPSR